MKTKAIDFLSRKEQIAEKKEREKKSYDEAFERRFHAMPQKHHDLLKLITEKIEICRKLNEFLRVNNNPKDFLTHLEHKILKAIYDYLQGKGGD